MPDKVKPLKMEDPSLGGTQNDMGFPTETNATQDYLACKGIAFENLDTFILDKIGRSIVERFPDLYQRITYSSGVPTVLEFFNSSSFITANRLARHELSYTDSLLTGETLYVYDTNGSTILRTYLWTHVYSGSDLDSSSVVIT